MILDSTKRVSAWETDYFLCGWTTYNWEPVLFICRDLCLKIDAATHEDVQDVRGGANVVDDFPGGIFLLVKMAVELLDVLGWPRFEEGDLVEIFQSL